MNSFNDERVDCPICMDCITGTKNRVTTECGHCFHTNCLMTNVAHNGFGCPYCRAVMAEEVKEENSEWGSVDNEEEEYALRGLRFMFNRLSGDQDDQEDIRDENEAEEDDEPKPSAEYITQKLVEQGVTMLEVVKAKMAYLHEYENDDNIQYVENDFYIKLHHIIINFLP